ncbi:hypothetical protein BGW42_008672 [Actinomortierella wolfii]|nr:hypothetical protein BGW42_008672 [Actinomortierella wolfii]
MQPSSWTEMRASRRSAWMFTLGLLFITLIPSVSASIFCSQPQANTYNIDQKMIFDWGDDGNIPTRKEIETITATLFCDSGSKITEFILKPQGPNEGVVPFVGNATTAGGTQGPCLNNAFHVEYMGTAKQTFLFDKLINFGPIRCGSITILPAANNSFPITTVITTSTTTTKSQTSSATTAPTTPVSPSTGGVSTSVVIIIVVVAIVILVLAGIVVAWYLRKKRIERMEAVIMPWKKQDQQEFSKVSSTDESRGNVSDVGMHGANAGATAGAFARNKGQAQATDNGGVRFNAYDRQASSAPGGGYRQQQTGYDDYEEEDNYYNPYFAQSAATAAAAALPRGNPSYYSGFSTSEYSVHSPFSDPYPHQQDSKAYFPPPPSSNLYPNSSTTSLPISSAMVGPHASGAYASSALNILPTHSTNSSPRRAPQMLPEKGHRESDPHESHQMQDIHKVEVKAQ